MRLKRRAMVAAVLLALLVAASAQATTAPGHRARARAKRDAASELARAVLPERAKKVRGDQSVLGALRRPRPACSKKQVVYKSEFLRVVPGKPADVWSWVASHRPAHYIEYSTQEDPGSPFYGVVMFYFRAQRDVANRYLQITVASRKGGGSAIRVDGVAVWETHPGHFPCTTSQ